MESHLICVFGVSGVGKSTLIHDFVTRNQGWESLSVSKVISTDLRSSPESFRTHHKAVVEENQQSIATAILDRRHQYPNRHYLLDAHAIIESEEGLVEIAIDAVRILELRAIGVVIDSPIAILERRRKDTNRQRLIRTTDWIDDLQVRTIELCGLFAKMLEIPYFQVRSGDLISFENSISALAKEGSLSGH